MDKKHDRIVNKSEFAEMIEEMSLVLAKPPIFDEKKLDTWFKYLKIIKARHIETITYEIISTEKFFPQISVILAYNRKISSENPHTEEEISLAINQAQDTRSFMENIKKGEYPKTADELFYAVRNIEHIPKTAEELKEEKERQLRMARKHGYDV